MSFPAPGVGDTFADMKVIRDILLGLLGGIALLLLFLGNALVVTLHSIFGAKKNTE